MSIAANLERIRQTLPEGVELCAVSKFHPVETLLQAYEASQRCFGESRVQELAAKVPQMPAEARWHFIGHLQTNKVRQLLSLPVAMIESVDSERLLDKIEEESLRLGRTTDVLLQLHVAAEETKFGFTPEELLEYIKSGRYRRLKAVRLRGVMGMATNTDDSVRIRQDFELIAQTRLRIRNLCPDLPDFETVSMGMSDDYPLAISCGSTLVRVGSAIFGPRQY